MATDRRTEYVIYIKMDDELIAEEAGTTPDTAATATGEPISQKAQSGKKKKTVFAAAYGYAKRLIAPIVANTVNTVSLRTGHSELQRRQQYVLQGISTGFDIGESILAGGIIGGAPGAVVGAAVGVATKIVSYEINRYNYELERTVDSVNLAEARRRAGTSWDRIGKNI